jgi:hypothetical protein
MRYGFKKKTTAPVDLVEIFRAFATIPADGISDDTDFIETNDIQDYKETLEEVTLVYYLIPYKN